MGKQTSLQIFICIAQKSVEVAFTKNFLIRELDKRARLLCNMVIILSIFRMIFQETNLQERMWRAANDAL